MSLLRTRASMAFLAGLCLLTALAGAWPVTLQAQEPQDVPPPPMPGGVWAPGAPIAGVPRLEGRPTAPESPEAVCPGPDWHPLTANFYTGYYMTAQDYANNVNRHCIAQGEVVPRNAYAIDIAIQWLSVGNSGPGCSVSGCPVLYNFYLLNSSNQQLYRYQVYSVSVSGARLTYLISGNGPPVLIAAYLNEIQYLNLPFQLNCLVPGGNYSFRVEYILDNTILTYVLPFPFGVSNTGCTVPPIPSVNGPSGCVNTLTPTLSWNASPSATSYHVFVRDTLTGSTVVNQDNWGPTSYTVPANLLQAGRSYTWSVRARNQYGESGDSVPLTFTPMCQAPSPPHAIGPSGCISTHTPQLSWTSSTGADYYRVRVVDDQTGQAVLDQQVTATFYDVPGGLLQSNRRYRWAVRAGNEHGLSGDSNVLEFTPECGVPPAPTASGPSGCIPTLTPTLQWSNVSVADHYEYYVVDTEDDTQVIRSTTSSTFVTLPSGLLTEDRAYHWRVRAHNSSGDSPWSNLLSFTPLCGPPQQAPTPLGPTGCVDSTMPTLSWTAVPRATSYHLYVSNTATGAVVINHSGPNTYHFTPPGLLQPGTQYHWHVKGTNSAGDGPTSPTVFFTPICEDIGGDPDIRPEDADQGPQPACDAVGEPISVTTGNVYFDQTDVVVRGVGTVAFTRSYNSANVTPGRYGIFGPGWSHPYETSLKVQYNKIALREPDGSVLQFLDDDNDGRFDPIVPPTEQSWIVSLTGGGYERRFRAGGAQRFSGTFGRLALILDPLGNIVTSLAYDTMGKLYSVRDLSGRALTLTYDGPRIRKVEAPAQLVVATYGYDASNRLETVTYGDGTGYRFGYDPAGRVLTVKDLSGKILESHTYYPDGRGWTSEVSEGRERLTLVYQPLKTVVTDALGNETTYDYVSVGGVKRVSRITGPCSTCGGGGGDVQEWTYDAKARVKTHSRGPEDLTTYEYDPESGDLLLERDVLLNTTTYTYYADGRPKTVTGPEGTQTTLTYVAAGPATLTEAIDAERSRTSSTRYTALGKPEQFTDFRGKITTYTYDPAVPGDLREVRNPEGEIWKYTYDEMGRRKTVTDPLNKTTETRYDARGRIRRTIHPDQTFVEYGYDSAGRPASVTDALGRRTRKGYDAYGRLQFGVDAQGGVVSYEYDLMSRVTAIKDARGKQTSFERDGHGRLKRIVYPDGATESFTYDAMGRRASRTDRRGVKTVYQYDALGRLSLQIHSEGEPRYAAFGYDVAGRMTRAVNGHSVLDWEYDRLGRVLSEKRGDGSVLRYTYDDASNRTSLSFNGSTLVEYQYDDVSRLTSQTAGGRTFIFGYDDASRRVELRHPNGIVTRYQYDPNGMGRLEQVKATLNEARITEVNYAHDLVGNRTRRSTPTVTEDYGYDRLDRLVAATHTGLARRFRYDAAGNRTVEDANGNARQATFNDRNQLVSRTPGGRTPVAGVLDESAHVKVNGVPAQALVGMSFEGGVETGPGTNVFEVKATDLAGNQRTQSYSLQVSGATEDDIRYDANGNLVRWTDAAGQIWAYEWNGENQLTRVTRNDVEVVTFYYDPLGRRIEKVAGGVVTAYRYDGQDIITETRTAGGTTTGAWFLHGPGADEPLARFDSASGLSYYHADGLGSIIATTNDAGTVTSIRAYDAWGNIESGSTASGYAFTGREWDAELGLYYYRARYYDPKSGRFISEDPIRFDGGVNFYAYVEGRPTLLADPLGLAPGKGRAVWKAMAQLLSMITGIPTDSLGGIEKELDTDVELATRLKQGAKLNPPPHPAGKVPTIALKPKSQLFGGRRACRLPRGGATRILWALGAVSFISDAAEAGPKQATQNLLMDSAWPAFPVAEVMAGSFMSVVTAPSEYGMSYQEATEMWREIDP